MVIIAMAMVGLLAFIGLMVDAGILFIGVGHLRRAVDAAALAAAAQFREGRSISDQIASAKEVVHLNGVDPTELLLWKCVDPADPIKALPYDTEYPHDPALCGAIDEPQRKLIYVEARTNVRFSFLSIIGLYGTEIVATAVSEAASVDVVLAIDTSDSMAVENWPTSSDGGCNDDDPTGADGFPGDCHPFQEVKQAAAAFVRGMYYPYDRVAVVTFDNLATVQLALTDSDNVTDTVDLISALEVSPRRNDGDPPECELTFSGDPPVFTESPQGCPNTSVGYGLTLAGDEFGKPPIRQESVWVVIVLTDGAANASEPDDDSADVNRYCPPTGYNLGSPFWMQPLCRDAETGFAFTTAHTRRSFINPAVWGRTEPYNPSSVWDPANTDADDYAAARADFVACAPTENDAAEWCKDSLDYSIGQGGQGATIYAIGLGPLVTCIGSISGGECIERDPSAWTQGRPDAGDRLLRYVANVGIDGDPNPNPGPTGVGITDPCLGVPVPYPLTAGNDSYSCGNYFFSESGTGLSTVFESIASRIFTRLTQ
jgi:hypothetical protein